MGSVCHGMGVTPGCPWEVMLGVPMYLQAGDSEAPGIVRVRRHWYHEGAVGDVLLIELDGDLVVTWGGTHRGHPGSGGLQAPGGGSGGPCARTRLLHKVGDAAGPILAVLKGDLSLAGPFDSDGEAPSACLPCPDAKLGWGAHGGDEGVPRHPAPHPTSAHIAPP